MEAPLMVCVLVAIALLIVLINKIETIAKNQKRLGGEMAELRKAINMQLGQKIGPESQKNLSDAKSETTHEPVRNTPTTSSAQPQATLPSQPANTNHNSLYYRKIETPIQPAPTLPRPAEKKRELDWEKFVGENILSKIGIVVLVLGLGFFVKFAIDNNWINPAGRVAIGFACGGILLGIGYAMQQKYKDFSAVLSGGGLAVFYLTVTIAYQIYHILNQPIAFALTLIITILSVCFSLLYDRQELAIFSLVGGFASPFMVSSGSGNYLVLFSYLTILDLGMLALAYFKKWRLVNYFDYAGTIIIFLSWIMMQRSMPNFPYRSVLSFATVYYIIFFLMTIVNNIKNEQKFVATEISMLLSNVFIYFSIGYWALGGFAEEMRGSFAIAIALINLAAAWFLHKRESVDKNLFYLLVGIVLTFTSLSAPIQLNGHHITLFWSAESALLLWLYLKSQMPIMKNTSALMVAVTLISLTVTWSKLYTLHINTPQMPILFNQAMLTSVVCIIALFLYRHFLGKLNDEHQILMIPVKQAKIGISAIVAATIYCASMCELVYQLKAFAVTDAEFISYTGLLNYIYICTLMIYLWYTKQSLEVAGLAGAAAMAAYLVYYQIGFTELREVCLKNTKIGLFPFNLRYLNIALLFAILYYEVKIVKQRFEENSPVYRWSVWSSIFVLVFACSAELVSIAAISGFRGNAGNSAESISSIRKIGFPVLWGALSFMMMFVGMKQGNKQLRIISLSLFMVAILKLLAFDAWEMSPLGKIISFSSLGVLILIVAFLYQKFKRIILDGDLSNKKDQNV